MIITVLRFVLRRIAFFVPDYFTVQSQSRVQELEGVLGEKEKVVQGLQKQVRTRPHDAAAVNVRVLKDVV